MGTASRRKLNPAALTITDLARVLSAGGKPVTKALLRADLAAGAPVNAADGTMNLTDYTAWLVKTMTESKWD